MPAHQLNDPYATVATWHLPDMPDRRLVGTLKYAPGWTEIELHGTLKPLPLEGALTREGNLVSYPIVYGVTRESELVTVLRAARNTLHMSSAAGGFGQHETIVSRMLCFGAHIVPDQTFPSVSFRIPGLEVWLSNPPMEHSVNDSTDKTDRTWLYKFHVRKLEPVRIDAIKASIEFRYQLGGASKFASADVAVSACAVLTPDEPQTLDWYIDQHSKLGTLLAFLAGTPMSPDRIETPTSDPGRAISLMLPLNNVSYCDYQTPDHFFIPRSALGDDLGPIVAEWFKVYPQVEMPSQIAVSLMAANKLWSNVEFISLMQVLEGFHRGTMNGTYLPPEQYATIEFALVNTIPVGTASDLRAALGSRLKYGNEFSLKRRTRELLDRLPMAIRQALVGKDGKIAQRWIDTRNYYTHWDEGLRSTVLSSQDLYHANIRLHLFARVLFLNLMGVSSEAIAKALMGAHRSSQHLMQINDYDERRR